MRDADEDIWIREARQGSIDAFNCLVERFQTLAYGVAFRYLGNANDAADVTQDAFFSAYRALTTFRGGSFSAWLLRIVVNACHDAHRRSSRRPTSSMDIIVEELGEAPWEDEQAPDPESEALSIEAREEIERALARLPDEQRLAIVLVDVEGLSYEEAAAAAGCAVCTIRSRLARGRSRVRDELLAAGMLS